MNVVIVRQQPAELRADREAFFRAFGAIFDADAAEASRLVESLQRHATYPDFRCFTARDADADGALLGLAYGYTSQPGQWFHDRCAALLGPDGAARWLIGAFEFVEFGVIPPARRFGIGARLYDAAFAGLTHRTAILATQRDNATAQDFYARRGWRYLADLPGSPPSILMGLDRAGDPH